MDNTLNHKEAIFGTQISGAESAYINLYEGHEIDEKSVIKELTHIAQIEGYKKATIILLGNAIHGDNLVKDSLVHPIVFCARHYIELSLKSTLRLHRISLGEINPNQLGFESCHELNKLWGKLKFYLPQHENYEQLESLIHSFHVLDEKSFTFRYPYKSGKKFHDKLTFNIDNTTSVDFDHFRQVFQFVFNILDSVNDRAFVLNDEI